MIGFIEYWEKLEKLREFATARSLSKVSRAEQFESSIRNDRLNQPELVRRMFGIDVACQALIASEVLLVLWSLHLPLASLSTCIARIHENLNNLAAVEMSKLS